MIGRYARKFWIWSAAAGICGVFVLLLSGGWSVLTGGVDAEDGGGPTFYFRVYAEVEFDGEPVVFDEILACRGFTFQRAGAPPNRGYKLSAQGLGRRLQDGGGLFMSAPWPCGYVNRYLSKLKRGDKGGKPLEEIRAPENHLPYFFWADNADEPTVMEGYVSEIYFEQPYARLKVKGVSIGPFGWEVPSGRRLVDDYVDDQDPLNIFTLRQHPRFRGDSRLVNWFGRGLFPIHEEEWRTSPTLVAALDGIRPQDGLYSVPAAIREAGYPEIEWPASSAGFSSKTSANRHQALIRPGNGLPRYGGEISLGTGAENPGHDMFVTTIRSDVFFALRRVEEVVPMDCVGNRCEVLEGRRGYYRFQLRRSGVPDPVDTIVYQGVEIGVEYGAGLFYDPKTRVLWLVADETI